MIDWSSTFDIVFAAVAVALILFFLLSAIIVAAKGKRACNAFDVILRILATVALIASAVMFVCAVFTKLDGDNRIYVDSTGSELIAKLYLGGQAIDLPFPRLFGILSTTVGSNIIAILLIVGLVALIVDCLVANKKSDKKAAKKAAKNQPKKSPEQLKREAELERIRRLGEQAVRKTNEAARASARDEKTDAPTAAEPERQTEAEQEQEQEPTADWRTSPQPDRQTGFVGIKDEADDFDTFDDFAADPQDQTDACEQPDDADGSAGDETPETYEPVDGDEYAGDEQSEYDGQTETGEFVDDGQPIATEEDIGTSYEPVYDGSAEDNYLYEQPAEQLAQDDPDDVRIEEQIDEPTEQPTESAEPAVEHPTENAEPIVEQSAENAEPSVEQQPNVEPDRDIYIPEMRTIVKQDAPEQAPQAEADKKPRAKRNTSPKPRAARPATKRTAEQISDDKRLPVTRRYVILDRRNAVNMFGEYLKERNQAEKDKLKSSINTIIIE